MTNNNELNREPYLLALGQTSKFKLLFNQIEKQLNDCDNKNYSKSKNSIKYNDVHQSLVITTKYYDLSLNVKFVDSIQMLNDLSYDEYLEAVLVFLDDSHKDVKLHLSESFENLYKNNKEKLNILITKHDEHEDHKITKDDFMKKFDDFVDLRVDLSDKQTKAAIDNQKEDQEDDNEDEYTDLDELINSLFVHSWSKMKLKDDPTEKSDIHENLNNQSQIESKEENHDNNNVNDDDLYNFENLIMNLKDMRQKAEGLSFEERKKYAENVVMNFWKTLGGDEDELVGLSDQE